jgi:hypothetical protein
MRHRLSSTECADLSALKPAQKRALPLNQKLLDASPRAITMVDRCRARHSGCPGRPRPGRRGVAEFRSRPEPRGRGSGEGTSFSPSEFQQEVFGFHLPAVELGGPPIFHSSVRWVIWEHPRKAAPGESAFALWEIRLTKLATRNHLHCLKGTCAGLPFVWFDFPGPVLTFRFLSIGYGGACCWPFHLASQLAYSGAWV